MRKRLSKLAMLALLLLLAFVVTGGIFAYGYNNSSTTLAATMVDANFADVTVDSSDPAAWDALGNHIGATGDGSLFEVSTMSSEYTGDLALTMTLTNTAALSKVYRSLFLRVVVLSPRDDILDINEDGLEDENDYVILSLTDSVAHIYLRQVSYDYYYIKLDGGWYKTNPHDDGWGAGDAAPEIYCEISQR